MANSFKATEEQITRIISSFDQDCFVTPGSHERFRIKYDDCTIIIYASGTVLFQGKNADIYAATFFSLESQEASGKLSIILPQAGSDEVGTGDFFGPVCVCACYLDRAIYSQISHLNLIDSKQLSDPQILKIAEELIDKVPHSLLILDNMRYNRVIGYHNMNEIKAMMHNKCYLNLQQKGIKLPELTVIDDFCGKNNYYDYLRLEPEVVDNITFEKKAENKYPAVACGALISRYAFLKSMDDLSAHYGVTFPKGAGSQVDEFAREFVKKYGKEELLRVAKSNFRTIDKL